MKVDYLQAGSELLSDCPAKWHLALDEPVNSDIKSHKDYVFLAAGLGTVGSPDRIVMN